jgi:hypothetical protein
MAAWNIIGSVTFDDHDGAGEEAGRVHAFCNGSPPKPAFGQG